MSRVTLSLLLDVRTLISSFQAHASQAPLSSTPMRPQDDPERIDGTSAERGPSGVVHTQERAPEAVTLDQERALGADHVREPQERRNQRYVMKYEGREVKRVHDRQTTTKPRGRWLQQRAIDTARNAQQQTENEIHNRAEYSFESERDHGSDKENGGLDEFRPPLHSSSPKKEDTSADCWSLDTRNHHRRSSTSSLSFKSDDSDITSLLLDQSSVDTVVTQDQQSTTSAASTNSSHVPSERRGFGPRKPTRSVSRATSPKPKGRDAKPTDTRKRNGNRRGTRANSPRRYNIKDRIIQNASRKEPMTGRLTWITEWDLCRAALVMPIF